MPAKRTIKAIVREHDRWRERCINLMASENMTSPAVRAILASDMGHRYTLPVDGEWDGEYIENAYRGTRFTDEAQRLTEGLARQVFRCKHAYVNSLSGHLACMTVLLSACKAKDLVMAPGMDVGGYFGWVGPYLPAALGLRYMDIPFRRRDWDLDYERAGARIRKRRPALVVLGLSNFPFPFDIAPVREACHDAGAVLCYDASHVLGLVAGGRFQDPLKDGCDVMIGSTHKSFFGPQGGLVLSNSDDLMARVGENMTWRTLDNAHWNRVAALGQALEEMRRHGRTYAAQVVRNSKALAKALDSERVPLRFKHRGFTESHQVLLDPRRASRSYGMTMNDMSVGLEGEGIIIDSVGRLGTAEVTRIGMKERDMEEVAGLIVAVLRDRARVGPRVRALRKRFSIKFQ